MTFKYFFYSSEEAATRKGCSSDAWRGHSWQVKSEKSQKVEKAELV
jgi:hypothetical protein